MNRVIFEPPQSQASQEEEGGLGRTHRPKSSPDPADMK